jgi:hypothetical protein
LLLILILEKENKFHDWILLIICWRSGVDVKVIAHASMGSTENVLNPNKVIMKSLIVC